MKLLWLALALLPAAAHAGGTLSCPDLSAAVQVATCPSEAELKYTFTGYCADAARMYDKDPACADEKAYRQRKNVALWESRDGSFQGYVSCDLSPAAVRDAKAARIAVSRVGNLNRIACTYRHGIVFTQRTRAACKVAGDGDCATGDCKATCD
jgi:hypothetical protein